MHQLLIAIRRRRQRRPRPVPWPLGDPVVPALRGWPVARPSRDAEAPAGQG